MAARFHRAALGPDPHRNPPPPIHTQTPSPPALGRFGEVLYRKEEGLRAPLAPRCVALSVGAAASFLRGPAHLPGGITKAKNTAVVTGGGGRGGGPDGGRGG